MLAHGEDIVSECFLFPPILCSLLSFYLTVLAVEDVQRDKDSKHAAQEGCSDDSVYPSRYVNGGVGSGGTLASGITVLCRAFLVCVACLTKRFLLNTLFLCSVAVGARHAVVARYDGNIFLPTCLIIDDVGSVFDDACGS